MTEEKKDFIPFDELEDMLPEIEARLALITDEGWTNDVIEVKTPNGLTRKAVVLHKPGGPPYYLVCQCEFSYDATFIAHAPTDIRNLLDFIRMLKSQLDSVGGAFWREQKAVVERDAIIAELRQTLEED